MQFLYHQNNKTSLEVLSKFSGIYTRNNINTACTIHALGNQHCELHSEFSMCNNYFHNIIALWSDIWNVSYIELRIWNQVSYDHRSYERNLSNCVFLVFTHVMKRPCWCTKQWQNVAQVLYNNRIKLPKDFFRYCSVHQHGRRDVTWKPRIQEMNCWFWWEPNSLGEKPLPSLGAFTYGTICHSWPAKP